MDPVACKDCHPKHYQQWSGSMHAYAAEDPVFLAMNAKGQRDTDGALGDFCVTCHAPVALMLGLTKDGTNLDEVPAYARGVTCYFCHSAIDVFDDHNAPITLASDGIMRGGLTDPRANTAHASAYSTLHDRISADSSKLCGACHDIVTPKGVALERTFAEWKASIYSHEDSPGQLQTCGRCHMTGRDDVAADYAGVPVRRVHDHTMAGVDVALTDFPQMEEQLAAVKNELAPTVFSEICVYPKADSTRVVVNLENVAAGHKWPSGAAQDRRAWVELVAYDENDAIMYSSGRLEPTDVVAERDDIWRFGDTMLGDDGKPVHMFWEAASVESNVLPAPTALTPVDPGWIDTHRIREYIVDGPLPWRITVRVRIRPIGLDTLDVLIASGDLDESYRALVPTFDLELATREWTRELGHCSPQVSGDPALEPIDPNAEWASLIIGADWARKDGSDDPFLKNLEPDDTVCTLPSDTIVLGAGEDSIYQLEVGLCGHFTASQTLKRDVKKGDKIRVQMHHGELLGSGYHWTMQVAVGDDPTKVWERSFAVPTPLGETFEDTVQAPRNLNQGEPLFLTISRTSTTNPRALIVPIVHGGQFFWLDSVDVAD